MTAVVGSIVLTLLVVLLQVTILPAIFPTTFRPDAVLAAAMTWGAIAGYRQAVGLGIVGGFMIDLWSDTPIGLTGLLVGIAAFLTVLGETPIVPNNVLFPMVVTFVGELLLQFMQLIVFQAIGRPVEWVNPLPAIILFTAASSSMLVLLFYPIARWFHRRIGQPRLEW